MLAAVPLLFLLGCGDGRPSLVPVTGTVLLNGDPVEGARLGFEPMDMGDYKRASTALTDAAGKFTVGTYDQTDGMPAGSYRVSVFKRDPVGKLPENINTENIDANQQPIRYQWTVPQKYSSTEQSGLTVVVTSSGMTPETIELTGEAEMESVGGRANEP